MINRKVKLFKLIPGAILVLLLSNCCLFSNLCFIHSEHGSKADNCCEHEPSEDTNSNSDTDGSACGSCFVVLPGKSELVSNVFLLTQVGLDFVAVLLSSDSHPIRNLVPSGFLIAERPSTSSVRQLLESLALAPNSPPALV